MHSKPEAARARTRTLHEQTLWLRVFLGLWAAGRLRGGPGRRAVGFGVPRAALWMLSLRRWALPCAVSLERLGQRFGLGSRR